MSFIPRLRRPSTLLTVLAVGLMMVAGKAVPAAAQADGELRVSAVSAGGAYWFEVEGSEGRNPLIQLPPNTTITVHVTNAGSVPHNLHFGAPLDVAVPLLRPGQVTSIGITTPAEESEPHAYWCDPHRELLMGGGYAITSDNGDNGFPVPGTTAGGMAAVAAAAALARRWAA